MPASPALESIHSRTPATLSPEDYDESLDRGEVERPPLHLIRSFSETTLQIRVAHPKVGKVRNQDIDMLDSQESASNALSAKLKEGGHLTA